jgi:hypothetical protein
MPALTPSFLLDFESNMSTIQEDEYAAFSQNLWWSKYMRTRPSSSKRELVAWLIATAQIEDLGVLGGNMPFADIVSKYTEYTVREAGAGFKVRKAQIEDTDGDGMDAAAKWSSDIGAYMAYWPQKKLVELIKNGHSAGYESYDSVPFFSKAHKVNPFAGTATFANLLADAASSTASTDANDAIYPGACPIDDGVTLDVALTNLSKACAYIRSIRMPNNEDPRFLRPVGLLHGPRLAQRATQLTQAKFIAQAAASGGGSADVEALIKSPGLVEANCADELAGFESDTSYFIACEQMSTRQLGGFVYVDREPFKIDYYGPKDESYLGRTQELEYHCRGRNVAGYGHPFVFFKVKAS